MCDHHPEIIRACADAGWEFYSHGTYNTRYLMGMDEAQERRVIQDSIDTIRKHTGQKLDGWLALGAHLPPKEKRGLVLIDPPFERTDEFAAMFSAFLGAWRKWPTGVYALWHPVKDRARTAAFRAAFAERGVAKALSLSLSIGGDGPGLRETGLVIVNPPYTLHDEAQRLLPFLAARMARGAGAAYGVEALTAG